MENRSGGRVVRSMAHMRRSVLAFVTLGVGIGVAIASPPIEAKVVADFDVVAPSFQLHGRPVGGAKPATATPAFLTSSRIAALPDGALVIDSDSGKLIKTDTTGKPLAELAIGGNAGMLAYDP